MKTLRIRILCPHLPIVQSLKTITLRVLSERNWPAPEFVSGPGATDLEWDLVSGIAAQGFRIENGTAGQIRIVASDPQGLVYGMGKFLRRTRMDNGELKLCPWRGTSLPRLSMRGIYFATHFHNFYQEAPLEKVEAYIEDLALQGFNALNVWFDMHHFKGIDDPAAQEMLTRLKALLRTARRVGMSAGIGFLANEGYRTTPAALRATPTGRAHYGVEVCVATPEGEALVLKNLQGELDAFREVGLDFIWLWPYDQGGCACPSCGPWGRKGMLKIGEKAARLFRDRFPGGKVIFSTWLFDYGNDQGEWNGLAKTFSPKPDWVDYLLADSHDRFPRFPLEHGVPGGLPLLNFPEISMYGMLPWGGFGANPLIQRFTNLWGEVAHLADGGFPYSEGIFEDLNKAAYAQFYWTGQNDCREAMEEYFEFQFGAVDFEACRRILDLLEANHGPCWMIGDMVRLWGSPTGGIPLPGYPEGSIRFPRPQADQARAIEAVALCRRVELSLPEWGRKSWRWRIIALRALLDLELLTHGDNPNEACQKAFLELQDIYSAEKGEAAVSPPVKGVNRIDDSANCE
jgi:hypothetical protein